MNESEKEEKTKVAYLDRPTFWFSSRPWLMLAFIGLFSFFQYLVFKHGFPEATLETLISAQGTFFFSLFIAAVGFVAAFFYFFRYKFLSDELEKAADMVTGARNNDESVDFLALEEGFEKLDKPFPELYAEYSRSFRELRKEDGSSELSEVDMVGLTNFVSLRPSVDFFNEDTLYYSRINVPLYQSVPGILTGLGILFTFVGLAAGVALATRGLLPTDAGPVGIDSANVAELLKSIGSLLDGAGQAFITSIVGLFISFFFGSWLHDCEHNMQERIERLNVLLSRRIAYADPERLALVRTMRMIRQEQLMRSFSENWDMISGKFIEKLGAVMNEQSTAQTAALVGEFSVLRASVDRLATTQTDAITKEVRKAMEEFVVMLGNNMKDMTASFEESAQGVGKSVDALDVVLENTKDVMGAVSSDVARTMTSLSNEVDALEKKIAERAASFEEQLATMNRHSQEISERVETVGRTLVESAEAAGNGFVGKLEESSGDFARRVSESAEHFEGKVDVAGTGFAAKVAEASVVFEGRVVSSGQNVITDIGTAGEKLGGLRDDFAARIEASLTSLADKVDEAGAGLAARVNESSEDFATRMQASAEGLAARVTESSDEFAGKVSGSGEDFSSKVGASAALFAEKIGESSEAFEDRVTGSGRNVIDDIGTAGEKLDGLSASFASRIETTLAGFADKVDEAGEGLAARVSESSEGFANRMQASAEGLAVKVAETSDDFAGKVSGSAAGFAAGMAGSTAAFTSTVNEAVGGFAKRIGECGGAFIESIDTAAENFADGVDDSAEEWVKSVSSAGDSVKDAFDDAADSVVDKMNDAADEFAEKIVNESVEGAERIRGSFESVATSAAAFGEAIDKYADRQEGLTEQIVDAGETVSAATSNLVLAVQRCTALLDKTSGIQAEGDQISRDTLERAREVCSMISTTSDESLRKLNVSLANFVQTSEDLRMNAESIEKLLNELTESIGSALMRINDTVCTNMSVTDKSLSGALDSMSTALRDWTESQESTSENLRANTQEFKESIDKLAEATQSIGGAFRRLEVRVNNRIDSVDKHLEKASE